MKVQFSNKYKSYQNQFLEIITQLEDEGNTIYKGSRNTLKRITFNDVEVVIKAFGIPNIVNQIVYKFLRKSKAQRSYEFAHNLLKLGINTPEPIGYIESYSSVAFKKSYYICKHIDYDITYRELVHQPNYPKHEEILRAFTRFTYKMHESGILFKDHSPGNTLICIDKDGYSFFLVDLNRMRFTTLDFEARMENMKRLTPKKDMVAIMANEYAKCSNFEEEDIFNTLWTKTSSFQEKFHRKKRWKRKLKLTRKS